MKSFGKKSLVGILLVALMAPTVYVAMPQKQVEAAAEGIFGCAAASVAIGAGVAATVAKLVVPVLDPVTGKATTAIETKECILDGLLILVREVFIATFTQSIVDWINSGFEGNPAFVTDLGGYLLSVVDKAAGEFIYGTDLAFLCSPFKLQIQISLLLGLQGQRYKARCTLSGVVGNVENFLTGLSRIENWNQWLAVTTNASNNIFGATIGARIGLDSRVGSKRWEAEEELRYGRGFLSFKKCDQRTVTRAYEEASPGVKEVEEYNCRSVTPGAVIQGSLQKTLDLGPESLALADEINEIIGALIGQLLKQVLTSVNGLRGVSTASYGTPSYTQRVVNDATARELEGRRSAGATIVDGAVRNEQQYLSTKEESLYPVENAESNLKSLQSCYSDKVRNGGLTFGQSTEAQNRILQASSTIVARIQPKKVELADAMKTSRANLALLDSILSGMLAATTKAELDARIRDFEALQAAGRLRTSADLTAAIKRKEDIGVEMALLNQDTDLKLQSCSDFPQGLNI